MRKTLITLALTLLIPALSACRVTEEVTRSGEVLTYEQYQSIKIGVPAETIIARYGKPNDVEEADGKTTRVIYRCENRVGRYRDLVLEFDENENLRRTDLRDD